MTKSKTNTTTYTWIERNIAKIGPKTYRIRVGSYDAYAPSREKARLVKRALLNK